MFLLEQIVCADMNNKGKLLDSLNKKTTKLREHGADPTQNIPRRAQRTSHLDDMPGVSE